MSKHSETELILPSLYIMSQRTDGTLSTTELITELRQLLRPDGEDLQILDGRKDDKFSQIVRNLVSHRTLHKLGYASYSNSYFTITPSGLDFLNEPENKEFIEENFIEEVEGEYTIENPLAKDEVNKIYPNASLNIEKVQFSVYELKRKHEKGKLLLDPDFQREDVWKNIQKSELVESVLMNIPLPFIYLTENKKGNLIVVDGRQRLTALFEFVDNRFKLDKNIKILTTIAGFKFQDLDPLLQSIIEDCQLTTHVIKPPTSDRVMIDIFDRVNRSGTRLNNQEIRNALYQGNSTRLLSKLATSPQFKIATDNSVKSGRMKDKYIILRFLSFYIWRTKFYEKHPDYDYKGDTEEFLPKYMEYINGLNEVEVSKLEEKFIKSMDNAFEIFGANAFRLPSKKDNKKRPINMALFESLGYLLTDENAFKKKEMLVTEYEKLLSNQSFLNSFLSIDSTVKFRFDEIDKIKNKLHD